MCRSDAPRSTAIFRRSLTCMFQRVLGVGCWVLGAGYWVLGAQRRLFGIDVGEPAVHIGDASVDDVEECLLQGLREGTALTAPDADAIDRSDGRDLGRGPDDEHFVGCVETLTRDDR